MRTILLAFLILYSGISIIYPFQTRKEKEGFYFSDLELYSLEEGPFYFFEAEETAIYYKIGFIRSEIYNSVSIEKIISIGEDGPLQRAGVFFLSGFEISKYTQTHYETMSLEFGGWKSWNTFDLIINQKKRLTFQIKDDAIKATQLELIPIESSGVTGNINLIPKSN